MVGGSQCFQGVGEFSPERFCGEYNASRDWTEQLEIILRKGKLLFVSRKANTLAFRELLSQRECFLS